MKQEITRGSSKPWIKVKLQSYKSIMLPDELQEKIKLEATKRKQTIIQFISELLEIVK